MAGKATRFTPGVILSYIGVVLYALTLILPLYWLLISSFKSTLETLADPFVPGFSAGVTSRKISRTGSAAAAEKRTPSSDLPKTTSGARRPGHRACGIATPLPRSVENSRSRSRTIRLSVMGAA